MQYVSMRYSRNIGPVELSCCCDRTIAVVVVIKLFLLICYIAVDCGLIPDSPGFEITYSSPDCTTQGCSATYSCTVENAILMGNRVTRCQQDGSWSLANPHCFIINATRNPFGMRRRWNIGAGYVDLLHKSECNVARYFREWTCNISTR